MGSSASIHHRPVATTSAKTLLTNYPVLSQDQFLQNQRLAASISSNLNYTIITHIYSLMNESNIP